MGLSTRVVGEQKTKPYYMIHAEILRVDDVCGTKCFEQATWVDDLCIEVVYQSYYDGNPYEFTMRHGGSAAYDKNDKLIGWGKGGWKMERWFSNFDVNFGRRNMPELSVYKPHIPQEALEMPVGKTALVLKYVTGYDADRDRFWYKNWETHVLQIRDSENYDHIEKQEKELVRLFEGSASKGYVWKYDPEIVKPRVEPTTDDSIDDLPF